MSKKKKRRRRRQRKSSSSSKYLEKLPEAALVDISVRNCSIVFANEMTSSRRELFKWRTALRVVSVSLSAWSLPSEFSGCAVYILLGVVLVLNCADDAAAVGCFRFLLSDAGVTFGNFGV